MGNSYILITISVLASVSSSYGSQDQVITTSVGKTATLQCEIANQGSDLRSLHWKKDGTAIFSRTSDGEYTNGNYSVTDPASLVIPDVTESDGGNYSCLVAFWKSSGTEESDVMQLYVIDINVSDCKDSGQEGDGCSCYINGSNITSVECSASGFPHPPVITWEEEDPVIYQSSSINLTRFRENTTLTCKARDGNLKGAVDNKTVCVYYAREVTSTGGSPVEATTASVKFRALVAVIVVLSFALILLLLYMYIRYIRKKGKAFHFPTCIKRTSRPKTLEEPDDPPLHGKDIGANDAGRVEYVLMDTSNWKNSKESSVEDLPTSQPESTSIEGGTGDADFPPEDCNQNVSIPMAAMSSSNMEAFDPRPFFLRGELQSSERAAMSNAISRIIQDGIVTGISSLRGNSYLDFSTAMLPSVPMQNMTSSMTSSMVACNPLSSFLRGELQSSEIAAICNAFSQSILDLLETRHSGSRYSSSCSTAILLGTVSVPVEQTWQEEDEIQDPLSTAKLLEDRCRDSEESDNEHHDYMNT